MPHSALLRMMCLQVPRPWSQLCVLVLHLLLRLLSLLLRRWLLLALPVRWALWRRFLEVAFVAELKHAEGVGVAPLPGKGADRLDIQR